MSKLIRHGLSGERVAADHQKRMQAVERSLAVSTLRAYAGDGGPSGVRRALWAQVGLPAPIRCVNYDEALAVTQAGFSSSGATRYVAVYWPGGQCSGMTYLVTQSAGAYTDGTGRSGTALYSTDGTTLTRQATLVSTLSEGVGLRKRTWTASATLMAGIYYVAFRLVFSAGTPTLGLASIQAGDGSALGGDANNYATPQNWPLLASQTDASQQLPATQAISGLTIGTATALVWAGLF